MLFRSNEQISGLVQSPFGRTSPSQRPLFTELWLPFPSIFRMMPSEVCVGITQMRQKSISRFLTLGITLSIAIVLLFSFPLRIGCRSIWFTCTHSRSWVICAHDYCREYCVTISPSFPPTQWWVSLSKNFLAFVLC